MWFGFGLNGGVFVCVKNSVIALISSFDAGNLFMFTGVLRMDFLVVLMVPLFP